MSAPTRLVLFLATALLLVGCRSTRPYDVAGVVPAGAAAFNTLVPAGSRIQRLAGGFA